MSETKQDWLVEAIENCADMGEFIGLLEDRQAEMPSAFVAFMGLVKRLSPSDRGSLLRHLRRLSDETETHARMVNVKAMNLNRNLQTIATMRKDLREVILEQIEASPE